MTENIIEEAYAEAINVLKKNATPIGFSASPERHANYFSVWSRDHSICTLAALCTHDEELIDTAKKGILKLLRAQSEQGQVPSYIEIENSRKVYGGLGGITSTDSNMWVAIAAALLYKRTKDKRFISEVNLNRYRKLYHLLRAFDSNKSGLVIVHVAGDWADIFNRTYHVLYDECVYYEALKSLAFLHREFIHRKNKKDEVKSFSKRLRFIQRRRAKAKRKINEKLWFTKENVDSIKEEYMIIDSVEANDNYYLSHVMPFKMHWARRFDSFGNVLAIATKVANKERSKKIINHVFTHKINEPVPLTSLSPPVFKRDRDWEGIYSTRERPYEYHNGGIWPVIAGFWIYVLTKNNRKRKAADELLVLAKKLKEQNYVFPEYMHGKTAKPLGRRDQAWSAAGYIIAYHAVKSNVNLFDF